MYKYNKNNYIYISNVIKNICIWYLIFNMFINMQDSFSLLLKYNIHAYIIYIEKIERERQVWIINSIYAIHK